MTRQSGVTLVELLIGLVVLALLAMAANPFTERWMQESKITQTGTQLAEMISIAKARASLNVAGVVADPTQDAVSLLCLSEGTLHVKEAGSATPMMSCDEASLVTSRESVLPYKAVVLDNNGQAWECACFNSRGLITTLGDACSKCSGDLKFIVHAGNPANGQSYEYR